MRVRDRDRERIAVRRERKGENVKWCMCVNMTCEMYMHRYGLYRGLAERKEKEG